LITEAQIAAFRTAVLDHYRQHRRDLPWRRTHDPYEILVSEMMLQQTQVPRVIPYYSAFLATFPTVRRLADATMAEVLGHWQGLGYNRRALSLHKAAHAIVKHHDGRVPHDLPALLSLPGVGRATAGAVSAFAFGIPVAFIETNIRAAFIDSFFPECPDVPDSAILPLVEATLDRSAPRDWYYALMDYGAHLKRQRPDLVRRSRHHIVQLPFAGSRRQLRAAVLRHLLSVEKEGSTLQTIHAAVIREGASPVCLTDVLSSLEAEGFVVSDGRKYRLA
jgi:A/G-specific adenine glycosylase